VEHQDQVVNVEVQGKPVHQDHRVFEASLDLREIGAKPENKECLVFRAHVDLKDHLVHGERLADQAQQVPRVLPVVLVLRVHKVNAENVVIRVRLDR